MDLTPRRTNPLELLQGLPGLVGRAIDRRRRPERSASGFGLVLDSEVPVFYAGSTGGMPLGIAHAARVCPRAVILLFFTVSKERRRAAKRIRQAAVIHRLTNPGHTIAFVCNTEAEARLMREQGEVAFHLNQNMLVPERVFRPLPGHEVLYDAVYNARLAPFKRHELSLDVESCAFIYYDADQESAQSDAAVRERHRRVAPGHVFVNRLEDGRPVPLRPAEVNEVYNQATVGLCLSAREGAMFASMEYMLAGLPIVSTPSQGGRDVYFDDDYCIIADPDPRHIRDAVAALKARAIPRDFVVRRTREKVDRDRQRLVALLDELRSRHGLPAGRWDSLFEREVLVQWRPWAEFLAQAADACGKRPGGRGVA